MDHIDIIRFFPKENLGIIERIAAEYQKGQSISDIARLLGKSKCYVLARLKKSNTKSRSKTAQATNLRQLKRGKQGAKPYFGFCYFEGEITKDPREFPTLVIIQDRWKSGRSIHEIVKELNLKKIPSRTGKTWSWAAVQNIVTRLADGKLKVLKGGKYEFT